MWRFDSAWLIAFVTISEHALSRLILFCCWKFIHRHMPEVGIFLDCRTSEPWILGLLDFQVFVRSAEIPSAIFLFGISAEGTPQVNLALAYRS